MKMYSKYKIVPFCSYHFVQYHFVHTILSATILSGHHCKMLCICRLFIYLLHNIDSIRIKGEDTRQEKTQLWAAADVWKHCICMFLNDVKMFQEREIRQPTNSIKNS